MYVVSQNADYAIVLINRILLVVDPYRMKNITHIIMDENGGEVLEYALIAGLIIVAALATISAVGTKVLAYWGSINSSM
jgi:Flp pilus assembly pilin Flp